MTTEPTREIVTSPAHADWNWVWTLYEASFPQDERRTASGQAAILQHPRYRLEIWRDQETPVGFTALWIYKDFHYLEHFAMTPLIRSKGYGSRILSSLLAGSHPPLILEI